MSKFCVFSLLGQPAKVVHCRK